jgi:hypothetical protein
MALGPGTARRSRWSGLFLSLLAAGTAASPRAPRCPQPHVPERVEHFALGPAGGEPEAVVAWRSHPAEGGRRLEFEAFFRSSGIRVLVVECLGEEGPRHVYREMGPAGARTLLAEWRERGRVLFTVESSFDGSLREACDARRGAVMPLYLVELLRGDRLSQGSLQVLDPLARGLERWRVSTSYASVRGHDGEPAFRRRVELRREDGTLAGRYDFQGDALVGFLWQEGGREARPIDASTYASLGGGRAVERGGDHRAQEVEALLREARPEVKDVSGIRAAPSSLAGPQGLRVQ